MIRVLLFTLLLMQSAYAFVVEKPLADAALEARAQSLFKQTRCMVCAGESVAESNAELAKDMRMLIRDKVRKGEPDEAITAYLESRYGEEISLSPPVDARTYALWLLPLMLLALGYFGLRPKR